MQVTTRTLVGSCVLVVAILPSAAWGSSHIQLGGEGNLVRGKVQRSALQRAGGDTRIVTAWPTRVPAPRPVVTRTKGSVSYDYSASGGGRVRYVFTEGRTGCHFGGLEMVCYAPRPERGRPERRPRPPTAQEIVERTIFNVRLPRPDPNIDPGYAVTGMKAYLETGDARTHRFDTIPTVLGPLRITATSTYTVDWGDGSVTGPHTSTGGQYPDGTITHVYRYSRRVDVTVTQNWTANWTLSGQSGTIGGLRSVGAIRDFAVREVQAARER